MSNERKIYQMTEKQLKKYPEFKQNDYDVKLATFDENKAKLGKKFGLAKRNFSSTLLAQSREYVQGCWQGKLDKASGLEYSEDRNQNTYNLGYYRGYNENIHGYISDAINANPNFSHLKK